MYRLYNTNSEYYSFISVTETPTAKPTDKLRKIYGCYRFPHQKELSNNIITTIRISKYKKFENVLKIPLSFWFLFMSIRLTEFLESSKFATDERDLGFFFLLERIKNRIENYTDAYTTAGVAV